MQELSAWPAWANLVETLRRLAWKYKGRGSKGKNNGHWVGEHIDLEVEWPIKT